MISVRNALVATVLLAASVVGTALLGASVSSFAADLDDQPIYDLKVKLIDAKNELVFEGACAAVNTQATCRIDISNERTYVKDAGNDGEPILGQLDTSSIMFAEGKVVNHIPHLDMTLMVTEVVGRFVRQKHGVEIELPKKVSIRFKGRIDLKPAKGSWSNEMVFSKDYKLLTTLTEAPSV